MIFSFAQEEEIQSIIQIDSNKILIGTISEIVTMNANTWEIQRRCKAGYSFMNLTLLRDNTIIFGDEKSLYQYNMNENKLIPKIDSIIPIEDDKINDINGIEDINISEEFIRGLPEWDLLPPNQFIKRNGGNEN